MVIRYSSRSYKTIKGTFWDDGNVLHHDCGDGGGYKIIHVSKLIKPYSKISGLYVNYFGKADFEKIKSNLFLLAPSFIKWEDKVIQLIH